MKRLYPSIFLAGIAVFAIAATVKISDLTLSTSPSTNTFIEIADMNAATKSTKYLLTNLAQVSQIPTVPTMIVSNNVASAGLLAVDATKTNGIAATSAHVIAALGYTPMTNSAAAITNVLGYAPATNSNWVADGTTNSTLAGTARANNAVLTNGLTAGASTFTGEIIGYAGSTTNTAFRLGVNNTNTGWIANGANAQQYIAGGTAVAQMSSGKLSLSGDLSFGTTVVVADTILIRDAANTLALRNGTNAQAFNLYGTYTDSSNYERGFFKYSSGDGAYQLGSEKLGTGSARNLQLYRNGVRLINLTASNIEFGNHLIFSADNTYNFGSSGNAPANAYVATSIQYGRTKVCTSATTNALFYISVPNTNRVSGKIIYEVNSTDGTDTQTVSGECKFVANAKSTTVTSTLGDVQISAVPTGTLTAVFTSNITTNNVFALMLNPTTSLTTTNLTCKWRLETPSTFTVNSL